MRVQDYSFQPIDSKMYIIIEKNKALVIDPCIREEAFSLLDNNGVKEVLIILTHEHYDHISGVNAFKEKFQCQVVCSKKCAKNIQSAKDNISRYYDILFLNKDMTEYKRTEPYECTATWEFEEEALLHWEGHDVYLKETPGHSEGSICIVIDKVYVFTGDSLLRDTDVTTKMKSGSKEKYNEITKPFLENIAPDGYIYPGHGMSGYRTDFRIT
ncbi:MAG: MBL fold metallo-hydrolase [Roseburia sp.]|nr:MBL fold metallo-hydrolase [Roseburia sp.]